MKKILVSVGVIVIFVAYAVYQNMHTAPNVLTPIDNPKTTQNPPDPSPTPIIAEPSPVPVDTKPTPTPTPVAVTPTPTPTPTTSGQFKDGEYTGVLANAFYGKLQLKAIIQNGKLSDIQFITYPSDRGHTLEISQNSLPVLKSEAIAAQSAQVNIISGATQTSQAFVESLQSALSQAKS